MVVDPVNQHQKL